MDLTFLQPYRNDIRAGLVQALHGDDATRQMLRYHVGLETAKGASADALGKLLRPSLVLFVAEELGTDRQAALPAAIALELIHNFSLIHDDIEDEDVRRRGRATVWSLIGVAKAINAGDLMITLALLEGVKASPEAVTCLLDAMRDLVDGQSLDLDFESRWVTPPEYRAMIQIDQEIGLFRRGTGHGLSGARRLAGRVGRRERPRTSGRLRSAQAQESLSLGRSS